MAAFRLAHRLALASLCASLFIPSTFARKWEPTRVDYCFWSCYSACDYVTFVVPTDAASAEDDYYKAECTNTLKIESIYYCAQEYCTDKQSKAGRALLDSTCVLNAGISLPSFGSIALTAEDLANVERVNDTVATTSVDAPLDHAVIPDAEWFDMSFRTNAAFYDNWSISYDFSWACYGFWGLVVLTGMLYRALELFNGWRHYKNSAVHASTPPSHSSVWLWVRKRLILPATFTQHCQSPIGWCTIPPRLESITLALYIIMNIVCMFPKYTLFEGNIYYATAKLQLSRYIGDRSGIIATAQLPLVWVFAARNDPLLWLTGWSFATYNRFHRWVARIATLQAVIHSLAWTVYCIYEKDYAAEWSYQYWYCGVIATILMCFILVGSVYYIKLKYYDLFLPLHIILALIFMVALWDHVKIFDGEFAGFIWPCVAIWGLDRLLRLARLVYLGIVPRFFKGVRAVATYDASTNMIRVDITDLLPGKKITPGHFYYIYAPRFLRGYESHPMTLCSWTRQVADPSASPAISDDPSSVEKQTTRVEASVSRNGDSGEFAHTLLIRPFEGFTGRVRDRLLASGDSSSPCPLTIFLEGPYGSTVDLSTYSDVLVIAGGSGITAAISHSQLLLPKGVAVHVAWAVPQTALVDDICDNELRSVVRHPRFEMVVYLTRDAESHGDKLRQANAAYEVQHGRPDIAAVIRAAREQCRRNLAVVTSGTPQMADACRAAVVRVLDEPGPTVGYYNETLGW